MKKKDISLVISLLLPVALLAQAPDTTINKRALFPGSGSSTADTLTVPKDFVTEPGSFQQGKGAEVDTLDIQDGRLLLVLKDDHTWYYIKNFKLMESDSTFVKDWIADTTNPYTAPLESLPLRNSIALVDSASRFVCPNQTKVFSRFGMRHGRRHQGVDLPLKTGTPVVAAFDGRVRASTYNKGYGNLVIIRHENGLETFYAHLSKREVEVGDWVRAGDEIGLGGSTGRSTGPHLHFETRYQGYAFDPEWIADFEKGELRKNVFVLRRSYLDAHSRYTPESLDEEDDVYGGDEKIVEEEKRLAAERAAMRYHTVKEGESLSVIAKKEGKSLNAVIKLNPGINPDKLSIGQKIRVN
jgi:murein DD-endopeptidase MepM/ murein hydrolase activator NlpD